MLLFVIACEESSPDMEYANEPYVTLRFFTKIDLQPANVGILEINEIFGDELIGFQDTTSEFLLPLSMNNDFSKFTITYSHHADSTIHSDSMDVFYTRRIEITSETYVDVNCYYTQVLENSFDSLSLICKDTLGICKSNESVINVYF